MVAAPPSSSSLTPLGRLDPALINRAVHALLKHHSATSSESTSLFENELDVQVQLSLLRIPGNSSPKPIRIDIPHSFLHIGRDSQDNDGEEDGDVAMQDGAASSSSPPEICLIVKDSLKPTLQTLLSRVSATSDSSSSHPHAASTLSCIKKILTLTSLRQKHKTFSQKRELLAKYDLFLADDRILPMLPKALGKGFFHKKKQPLPICLTRNIGDAESDRDVTGLAMRLDTLLKATYLHLSSGTCLTVKAGTTSMSPERLVENIAAIAEKAPMKVPRKWANVRSISIKTTESVALPVYNKSPEEIEELLYLARVEKREDGVGEGEDVAEEKKEEKKKKRKDMAESTPLGKALKKQKSLEKKAKKRNDEKPAEIKDDTDDTAVKVNETTRAETVEKEDEKDTARKAKKAKKEKKKAEAVVVPPDDDDDHKPTEEKLPTETPKSSKKKSKKKSKTEESDVEPMKEETENHDQKTPENAPPAKTPKSSKKRKEMKEINDESTAATPATSKTSDKSSTKKKSKEVKESKSKGDVASSPTDEAFIPSKKFQGSKPGYVFRKDKKGLGYYKDVVPVVDKAWLKSLKTMGRGGGGGGRSKRGVSNTPAKRRKGGSRRSF